MYIQMHTLCVENEEQRRDMQDGTRGEWRADKVSKDVQEDAGAKRDANEYGKGIDERRGKIPPRQTEHSDPMISICPSKL